MSTKSRIGLYVAAGLLVALGIVAWRGLRISFSLESPGYALEVYHYGHPPIMCDIATFRQADGWLTYWDVEGLEHTVNVYNARVLIAEKGNVQ